MLNDSDANPSDSLTIVDPATGVAATAEVTVTTTGGGTVVINPDGTYEYTPAVGFTGEDTFDYSVTDTFGKTDTATVSIEVRDLNGPGGNTPPIATDDSFTLFTDVPLSASVMSNDTDPDGDVITIAQLANNAAGIPATAVQTITTAAGGTVSLNTDGTFTYVPPTGFMGEDTFDYTIVDPSGATDDAVVTLNVIADPDPNTNDEPYAGDDLASAIAGQVATANLLANDTDPNGDTLTITRVDGIDPAAGPILLFDVFTGAAQGSVEVDPVTGVATFTPAPGFTGTVQLPYTIDDGNGGTDTATMTFLIIDPAPVAEDDINATEANTSVSGNVLTNDSDENPADTLSVADPATGTAAASAVTINTTGGGIVVINADGTYEYTPATDFTGEDTFDYTVIDTFGKTDTATVSIEVRDLNGPAGNAPPIATDDSFTLFVDVPLTSSVLSNDADPDGDPIVVADASGAEATAPQTITTEQGGTVTLNPDGTFTYTPPADFLGQDSFDYSIVDPSGAIDEATVTLNVVADPDPSVNDDPQANDDLAIAPVGEPATTNILDNDVDPNGDPLIVTEVNGVDPSTGPIAIVDPDTGTPLGVLVVDPVTGEATFTPWPGFTGTVQVPYTVSDGEGGSDTGTMIFQFTDTSPVAEDDSNVTDFEVPVTGNLLTNDHDDNPADSLTVVDPNTGLAATGPFTVTTDNGGTVVINPDGSYELTPAAGFAGVDTFEYTVIDTFDKTDSADVSIEVRGSGEWSIDGPSNSDEGSTPQFTVSLSGVYGESEVLTVDLGLTDVDTNSSDYADLIDAIQQAVDANPDMTFDPVTGTITYTSPADSTPVPDLVIALPLIDDGLIEGPEDFTLSLTNATSSTGGMVEVDPAGASITSTINDTQGEGGAEEGPGQWSVSGPGEGNEGSFTEITVSLTGEYGAGEVLTVDLGLTDIDTNSSDYADIVAAIQSAVDENPDVSFCLLYTSPSPRDATLSRMPSSA